LYNLIENLTQIQMFQKELLISPTLTIDTECTGLDVFSSTWLLLQVKTLNSIFIFDIRKLGKYSNYIIELIKSSDKLVLLHNAKFDMKVIFVNTGIMLTNVYDSMITEVLINQGVGKQFYSLKELVSKYCGVSLDKEIRESFYNYSETSFTNELLTYSALDVQYLEKIYEEQMKEVYSSGQQKVYDLEMKLLAPVVSMEVNGVKLDKEAWIKLKENAIKFIETSKTEILDYIISNINFTVFPNAWEAATALLIPVKTKKLETDLRSLTNPEVVKDWYKSNINISSPLQIKKVFSLLGVPLESTGENELKKIQLSCPLANLLLTYREHTKKLTTYGDNFLDLINPVTGRIHGEFNQVGAQSGRFSSGNPNLQNIPKEEPYRHCFTSGENKSLICLDYSGQEYRLVGAISREPAIISAYKNGADMHMATAVLLLKKPSEEITKEERHWAKNKINFPIIYGSTKWGLSYGLGKSVEEAAEVIREFYEVYPFLHTFKMALESEIWKRKYSSTVIGRRRYFENKILFSDYKEVRKYEGRVKREGFNHVIQGTAADATKEAMCLIYYNNPFGDKLHLCMQIHDEIVTEVDDDIKEEAKIFQIKCMKDSLQQYLGEIPAMVDGPITKVWSH